MKSGSGKECSDRESILYLRNGILIIPDCLVYRFYLDFKMLPRLMCIDEIKDGIERRQLGIISWNKILWFAMDIKSGT